MRLTLAALVVLSPYGCAAIAPGGILQELIVVLGLMIPFLGILIPILALLLVQVGHRQPPEAAAASLEDLPDADGQGEPVPQMDALAAVAAGLQQVPAEAEELARLCSQLRESDVFEGLTDEELRLVAAIGHRQSVRAGERLARGGSRGESLFVILEGELRLLTHAPPEKPVRTAHAGETVPLAAIIDPPVLVTTVEAVGDAEVFAIPRIRLLDLFDEQPMIALQVYRAAAKAFEHRYRMTLDRTDSSESGSG